MRNERSQIHDLLGVPRSLDGMSYRVLEDPEKIREYVNGETREEWKNDIRNADRDPNTSNWLGTLSSRSWRLEMCYLKDVNENPNILNIKNPKTDYDFLEQLQKRIPKMKRNIEKYRFPLTPLVVREEDMTLMDGYCRLRTLRDLSVPRVCAYLGSESSH